MRKEYDLSGICLIEIGGGSCAGCIAVAPVAATVANECAIRFVRADIEDVPEMANEFKVERIPALVLADGGVAFAKCYGYQPQEILSLWVQAKVEEHKKGAL